MGEVGAVSGDMAALTIVETGRRRGRGGRAQSQRKATLRKTTIAAPIAAAGAAAAVAGDYCGWWIR